MKRQKTILMNLLLVFVLCFGFCHAVSAQSDAEPYIAVHSAEELSELFTKVKSYLDENGERLLQSLDDTRPAKQFGFESLPINPLTLPTWFSC